MLADLVVKLLLVILLQTHRKNLAASNFFLSGDIVHVSGKKMLVCNSYSSIVILCLVGLLTWPHMHNILESMYFALPYLSPLPPAASHQFHQYYIYGELNSCKVEKERMYNCLKWKTMGKSKEKAYVSLMHNKGSSMKVVLF